MLQQLWLDATIPLRSNSGSYMDQPQASSCRACVSLPPKGANPARHVGVSQGLCTMAQGMAVLWAVQPHCVHPPVSDHVLDTVTVWLEEGDRCLHTARDFLMLSSFRSPLPGYFAIVISTLRFSLSRGRGPRGRHSAAVLTLLFPLHSAEPCSLLQLCL